ncbi:hypothetical protein ACHAQJ_004821 [Trichoderma viride]
MNFRCFDYRDLLKHTDLRADGSHLGGLCSWIPDWRLPVARGTLSRGWLLEGSPKVSLDAASRALHFQFQQSHKDPGYAIHGSVEKISSVFPSHASQSVVMNWIKEVWGLVLSWVTDNTSSTSQHLLIHQLGMIFFQDHMKAEWSKAIVNYNWQMYYFKGYAEFTKTVLEDLENSLDEKLFTMLKHTMEGRRLFLLSPEPGQPASSDNEPASISKYDRPAIGIGPSHARPGDLICTRGITALEWAQQLHDCTADSTFLLRETDDDDDDDDAKNTKFLYIGEARANRRQTGNGVSWNTGRRLYSIVLC